MTRRSPFFPLFAICYSLAFLLTLPDFGHTWDSALGEFYFGDKMLEFWRTFDTRQLALDTESGVAAYRRAGQPDYAAHSAWAVLHPEHIWSLGPTLSALGREIFFTRMSLTDSITAQHLFLLPLLLCLFGALYQFVRREWDERVAALTVLALAVHPRFWADAHNNIKDVPSAVFFSLAVLAGYRAFTEGGAGRFTAFGALFGAALAAKANAFVLPLIFFVWLVARRMRVKVPAGLGAGALGIVVFLVLSPRLVVDFPASLFAQLRYLGEIGAGGGTVWKLMPSVNLLTTLPGVFVPCLVVGLWALAKQPAQNRLGLLLLLWALVPIVRVSLPYANDFDVIRHWLEVLPAFSVIIALGAARLLSVVPARLQPASAVALFAPVIWWNVVYHPFNIAFYNVWTGGLSAAQEQKFPQATDYWGSSYRAAIRKLNAEAPRNSLIFVGVGQHILQPVAPIWLRSDLELRKFVELNSALADTNDREIFLVYITRTEMYPEQLRELDTSHRPVWEFQVDGAPILKTIRLK